MLTEDQESYHTSFSGILLAAVLLRIQALIPLVQKNNNKKQKRNRTTKILQNVATRFWVSGWLKNNGGGEGGGGGSEGIVISFN